ncbi:HAD family hydrolase [Nesterenkonia flava]|nr:HAD family phosphatase [Nesterenkonia flava]
MPDAPENGEPSPAPGPALVLRLRGSAERAELSVRAAVFDCDGLLVDSESIWLDMLSSWLAEYRVAAEAEEFLGLTVEDTAGSLALRLRDARPTDPAARTAPLSTEQIRGALTARYSARLAAGVEPMPGAWRLFSTLAARIPVAVASNGLRRDVTAMLTDSELLPLAQAVCTVEDVAAGKPAPDLYLRACEKLGVHPADAVAFEDSPAGAQAAVSAGLVVVGVNPDPAVQLPAMHRLSSLDHVDPVLNP